MLRSVDEKLNIVFHSPMVKLPFIWHTGNRPSQRIRRRGVSRLANHVMPIRGLEPVAADLSSRTGILGYRHGIVPQKWIMDQRARRRRIGRNWLFLPFDRVAWNSNPSVFDPNPSVERLAPHIPGNSRTYRGHRLSRIPKSAEPENLPEDKSPLFLIQRVGSIPLSIKNGFKTDGAVWTTWIRIRAVSDQGFWFTNPSPPKAIHDPDFIRAMRGAGVKGLPGDEILTIKLYE